MKNLSVKNTMIIFTIALSITLTFQAHAEQSYHASQSDIDQEQKLIELAEQADKEAELTNPLWGFQCSTTDNESIITVTIKDKSISSVMLLNYTDDQLIATRGLPLSEIEQNVYVGSYKPMLLSTNSGEEIANLQVTDKTTLTAQSSSETEAKAQEQAISYEVQIAVDLEDSEQPKIQTSMLIKNGQPQADLNCRALYYFQKRTVASR